VLDKRVLIICELHVQRAGSSFARTRGVAAPRRWPAAGGAPGLSSARAAGQPRGPACACDIATARAPPPPPGPSPCAEAAKKASSEASLIAPTTTPALDTSRWPLLLRHYERLAVRTGHYTPIPGEEGEGGGAAAALQWPRPLAPSGAEVLALAAALTAPPPGASRLAFPPPARSRLFAAVAAAGRAPAVRRD